MFTSVWLTEVQSRDRKHGGGIFFHCLENPKALTNPVFETYRHTKYLILNITKTLYRYYNSLLVFCVLVTVVTI